MPPISQPATITYSRIDRYAIVLRTSDPQNSFPFFFGPVNDNDRLFVQWPWVAGQRCYVRVKKT